MFDPSKLDLDLDLENKEKKSENSESNKTENNSEASKNKVEKETNISNEKIEKTDINDKNNDIKNTDNNEEKIESTKDIDKKSTENLKTTENVEPNVDVLDLIDGKTVKKEKEVDPRDAGITEYEKNIIKGSKSEEKKEEVKETKEEEEEKKEKIIYDINIKTAEDVLSIVADKEYDFVTFEPNDENIKIIFRKDKVIVDTKIIKHPTYSNILIKAKALTKLTIEETDSEQEGSGEVIINNVNHKVISKVVPTDSGSKLFIKAVKIEKKAKASKSKKVPLSQMLTYMGALAFILLVVGGAFLAFIVMNAKTPNDVAFFTSLGVNLNDINAFMLQAVTAIFSVLVFIETAFLILYIFKFSVAKKEFKQKRIKYMIIATTVLFLTFATGTIWMFIDKKIRELPNWQNYANGDIQVYDNSKYNNQQFSKKGALLKDTSDLVGPVEIRFDLNVFADKEEAKGLSIKKFIWDFGNDVIKETPLDYIIYNFEEVGTYDVTLTVQEVDGAGTIVEKIVENIPSINVSYNVGINEKKLEGGGKLVDFDASALSELGKIEWYFVDNLEIPVWSGNIFRVGKPIFEETLIIMLIKDNESKESIKEEIFVISSQDETALNGDITYERSALNDLMFELKVENITSDFGNGYVEEFKWIIGDKEVSQKGDPLEPTESSKILFDFDGYGDHEIKVLLRDSAGEIKEISTVINIPRKLKLSKILNFYNKGEEIEDVEYDNKFNEYYINNIGVPTTLKIDARYIKSDNALYTLDKVDWDYDSDGDIDETNKIGYIDLDLEGNHTLTVYYDLVHRRLPDEVVRIKEKIFIESVRKEAIIDFDINKTGSYAPITVGFDASKSQVKDEDIVKFVWSYGDGITEERDSIVPGHKYKAAGNYDITLSVLTTKGKEYSITKELILKPKPQSIEITSSITKTPVGQSISFSSDKSEGHILGYLWEFGDGNISVKANPTHAYKKPGKYDVALKVDFNNNNVLEKTIEIEVY